MITFLAIVGGVVAIILIIGFIIWLRLEVDSEEGKNPFQ